MNQGMRQPVRDRMVKATRDLLCTMTDGDLTMNLVAETLKITAPTLYHYFEGKEEMIEAANTLTKEEITAIARKKLPGSFPPEMKIMTITLEIIDYIQSINLPASYLIENPVGKRSLNLDKFREVITELFKDYYQSKNKKPGAEKIAFQYLGSLAAEIAYCRKAKKELPEDLPEKIFEKVK